MIWPKILSTTFLCLFLIFHLNPLFLFKSNKERFCRRRMFSRLKQEPDPKTPISAPDAKHIQSIRLNNRHGNFLRVGLLTLFSRIEHFSTAYPRDVDRDFFITILYNIIQRCGSAGTTESAQGVIYYAVRRDTHVYISRIYISRCVDRPPTCAGSG